MTKQTYVQRLPCLYLDQKKSDPRIVTKPNLNIKLIKPPTLKRQSWKIKHDMEFG